MNTAWGGRSDAPWADGITALIHIRATLPEAGHHSAVPQPPPEKSDRFTESMGKNMLTITISHNFLL